MKTSPLPLMLAAVCLVWLPVSSCTQFCPSRVRVSIGKFDSVDSGARAAVRKLSEEIHSCPNTNDYSISWTFTADPQERAYRALRYYRRDNESGFVGYEYDPGSGPGPTYLVEDSAVDLVANEGGALSDFAKYQKKEGRNILSAK